MVGTDEKFFAARILDALDLLPKWVFVDNDLKLIH